MKMLEKMKKVLGLLLVCCVLLAVTPMAVFAVGKPGISVDEYASVTSSLDVSSLVEDTASASALIALNGTLALSMSAWNPPSLAGAVTSAFVNVTSDRTWAITSNEDWLTAIDVTPANRTGNGSFRMRAALNTGAAARTGTITVTAPGAPTRTITVTQPAPPTSTPTGTLTLSMSTWNPPWVAGTIVSGVVNVTSNRTWTITSDATWLTTSDVTPANRTGNGSFRMRATSNTGTAARTGTITVTAPDAPTRTITVTQPANPNVTPAGILTLSMSAWNPSWSANTVISGVVNVTSNKTWTITSDATWLTTSDVTPANRTGDGSFRMRAASNTGTAARTGTITVTAPGAPTRTIVVTQASSDIGSANTTVSWNANGGTVSQGSQIGTPGSTLGILPTPTRDGGHHFIGWFTTPNINGGTRVTSNTIVPSHNVTYYARWSDPDRHVNSWMPPTLPHTSISFRFTNGDATWLTAMRRGKHNWNNVAVPVTFYENSTSNNTATVLSSDGTYLGLIRMFVAPGTDLSGGPRISRFAIEMNSRTLAGHGTNYIESVFAHELGHAIGLRDNPVGTSLNESLMNHRRNRNIVTGPTNFDIVGVNILYN